MHITILASGSRGDVQPFVAVGAGLRRAGHHVRLAAPRNFGGVIGERGLEFFPLSADIRQMLESEEGRRLLESGGNPIKVFRQLARLVEPIAVQFFRDASQACEGADGIVCASGMLFVGQALVEKRPRPILYGSLQPMAPTRHQASCMMPALPRGLTWLGPWGYNRWTHYLSLQLFWQMFRSPVNRARQEVLGLPPRPMLLPMKTFGWGAPFLYGYSEQVVPRPPDWTSRNHITGYWFLDRPADWQPPRGLLDFLARGPAPVYVGFGSMNDRSPVETAAIARGALRRSGQRGVLLTGWGGLEAAASGAGIYVAETVPHDWLFPRMAAVVHHGGAGTTAQGLRAGVPSVVVPFMGDQPFWGRRVQELGVGPAPITRKRLSVDRLADAVSAAVSSSPMRHRAQALGERIRDEDGVSSAVGTIERALRTSCAAATGRSRHGT
jgi:UDP:flavonoid glycosyltransferase YjiC (YdhE family)